MTRPLQDQIGETVPERLAKLHLDATAEKIRKFVLTSLAETSAPPGLAAIRDALGLPDLAQVERVLARLNDADLLSFQDDEIESSYPFSAAGTAHRVRFDNDREVFALCATDAVGVHFLLNTKVTVLTSCATCDGPIELALQHGHVSRSQPGDIVEFVAGRRACGCNAHSLCPNINFFCTVGHLEQWRASHPDLAEGVIYVLDEVLLHARTIYSRLLR